MKYSFPTSRPDADRSAVWLLQNFLLSQIENRLGSRDIRKTICQPTFAATGPRLINTPMCDGAYAELSSNSAGYWPTALYELAHETVHLLNPIVGHTNWLEEGIAVAISVDFSRDFTNHPMTPQPNSIYQQAWQLVTGMPRPYYEIGMAVRDECGQLNRVTSEVLARVLPDANEVAIQKLTELCIPR